MTEPEPEPESTQRDRIESEWIDDQVALAVHSRQIAEHGGLDGIREPGLLESAMQRARNRWAYDADADMAALAAAYGHGIVSNHPFADGNKRTGYVVCRLFLMLNGYDVAASLDDKYLTFYRLAAGEVSETELAAWLRERLVRRS